MAFANVALLGASGKLGPSILNSLICADCFNMCCFAYLYFQDQQTEVVICCIGGAASNLQISAIIPAAVAAGVKRFIPSEFGTDTLSPAVRKRLPSAKVKAEVIDSLRIANKGATNLFSWTALAVGALFDLVIPTGFLGFEFSTNTSTLYDGGDFAFPGTTMSIVGEALVQVLKRPEETKNKFIYIKEFSTNGQNIIKALETTSGKNWTLLQNSIRGALKEAEVRLEAKDAAGWTGLLQRTIYYDRVLDACQAWTMEGDKVDLLDGAETKTVEMRVEELLNQDRR